MLIEQLLWRPFHGAVIPVMWLSQIVFYLLLCLIIVEACPSAFLQRAVSTFKALSAFCGFMNIHFLTRYIVSWSSSTIRLRSSSIASVWCGYSVDEQTLAQTMLARIAKGTRAKENQPETLWAYTKTEQGTTLHLGPDYHHQLMVEARALRKKNILVVPHLREPAHRDHTSRWHRNPGTQWTERRSRIWRELLHILRPLKMGRDK